MTRDTLPVQDGSRRFSDNENSFSSEEDGGKLSDRRPLEHGRDAREKVHLETAGPRQWDGRRDSNCITGSLGRARSRTVEAFISWYRDPLDRGVPIPAGDYRAHAPARSVHRSATL